MKLVKIHIYEDLATALEQMDTLGQKYLVTLDRSPGRYILTTYSPIK